MTSISIPSPRSAARQARSSRPSPSSVPSLSAPNGLSAPSLSTSTIKGHPCVYTKEYQEYYVKEMEELEKGKGNEWSVKKREFKVMREWEKEWKKRNGRQNGGEQEAISQDGDSSDFGAVLSKAVHDEKSLNLTSQRNPLPSLLRNSPSSLSSSSASSSDPDFVPDVPDPHPDHLPSSITHAIHSEVRKIYESPKKKASTSFIGPIQESAEVEVDIEAGGQKHMHWLENEKEEEMEKQRNLEDEMDEEENEDYLAKEDRQEKMRSLLERIGEKHDGANEEGESGSGKGEVEQKVEEIGGILEESLTTIHGVVEMEEDEEEGDRYREEMEEIEEQARQTFADSGLLQQLKDNYRCDCYDDEDQEMMKGVSDQYGMGIEGGLNSNSEEEEGGDDSDSLYRSMALPDQQPQPPSLQPSTKQHATKEDKSTKLKNLKKKEQKKRKKVERKRAKLAGELEKVKGEKRKAVDGVVSMSEGGGLEGQKQRKRKRKSEKGKGLNA